MYLSSIISTFYGARDINIGPYQPGLRTKMSELSTQTILESLTALIERDSQLNLAAAKVEDHLKLSATIKGVLESKKESEHRNPSKLRRGRVIPSRPYKLKSYTPTHENIEKKMIVLWKEELEGDKENRTLQPGLLMLVEKLKEIAKCADSLVEATPYKSNSDVVSAFRNALRGIERLMNPVLRSQEDSPSLTKKQATAAVVLLGAEWRVGDEAFPKQTVPIEYDSLKTELTNMRKEVDHAINTEMPLNNTKFFQCMFNMTCIIKNVIPLDLLTGNYQWG